MGDERWSYKGQLPWFKKTEHWFESNNPDQHGQDGPVHVATADSTGRKYPLGEHVASAWDELGVPKLPDLDQNAGSNIGRAYLCEARRVGKRQLSSSVYPLDGVTVLTDTVVKRVVLDRNATSGTLKCTGVELADGTVVSSKSVISSAGTFRSPQLLLLSGIGPSAHLKEMGIETLVDLPDVGQGLTDHMSFFQHWRLRDPSPGYTLGSSNPVLQQPQFGLGVPMDWIVCTDVPKGGLAEAIEKDEGAAPDASRHPLLSKPRTFIESILLYAKLPFPGVPMDADHLTTGVVSFLPTSRGSVTLRSVKPEDAPKSTPNLLLFTYLALKLPMFLKWYITKLILSYSLPTLITVQLNYLATEVDKYVYRSGLRQLARLMLDTQFGREFVAGESVPEGLSGLGVSPLSASDSDEKLDQRLALTGGTTWHPSGTCSMGKVVDSQLRVRGVEGLWVVDASVLPVPLSAHIQAPLYGLAEQAAAIIAGRA